ncbi:uncharacterized protein ACDP82_006471 [Pangshura tecta]
MAEDDVDGEEYDEEAEEDDLADSTQHSVSPNSQELFVTQELASQPSQDNEAMEDTSAANFSRLPTPSQRLSKIRRRKKKMREEMFSDIMEVTSKERAHLNEWKEVVSKYRKDASERVDRRNTRDERWRQEDRQEDQRECSDARIRGLQQQASHNNFKEAAWKTEMRVFQYPANTTIGNLDNQELPVPDSEMDSVQGSRSQISLSLTLLLYKSFTEA